MRKEVSSDAMVMDPLKKTRNIVIAGLQSIDDELYEAARIFGSLIQKGRLCPRNPFAGVFPILATPFSEDFQVDKESLREPAQRATGRARRLYHSDFACQPLSGDDNGSLSHR